MIRVVVDNRIRVHHGADLNLRESIRSKFTHPNPQREYKKRLRIPGWWAEPEADVTWCQDSDAVLSVPRGGLKRVRDSLRDFGHAWEVSDLRSAPGAPMPAHKIVMHDFQREAVASAISMQNCILRAPTGSGKTTLVLGLISQLQLRTLVIVPNRVLFDQWLERIFAEHGTADHIGWIREGKRREGDLEVGVQKSVALMAERDPDLAREYGLVVADEVQDFAAPTCMAAVDPFAAKYRIGVSADHRRKDKREYLIHDLFDGVAIVVRHEEMVRRGFIKSVQVRVVPTAFEAEWYGVSKSKDDDLKLNGDRLMLEMMADPAREALADWCVRDAARHGSRAIVFAHRREHCQRLEQRAAAAGIRVGLLLGGDEDAEAFQENKAALRDGSIQAGFGTYKSMGKGVDIPVVDAGVCVTPCAANEQVFGQVRGRICRNAPGEKVLYYLWDQRVHPGHLRNLARWNPDTVVRVGDGWMQAKEWLRR